LTRDNCEDYLAKINSFLTEAVGKMPGHREFVNKFCPMQM
jgi:hypothetical protein